MSSYRVYVGTFGKYAADSLKGKWLNLEDYNDNDKFMEACKELHKDEADPEFMFNDHEGVPSEFMGESWIDEKFWDYLNSSVDDDVSGPIRAWNTCGSGVGSPILPLRSLLSILWRNQPYISYSQWDVEM